MPAPVSVVMATYNGASFLRAQLDSIVSQLLDGDELVVVDDGSTDETLAILGSYPAPPLRIVRHPRNLGVLRSFERALSEARHDIVFLSDQDDIWASNKRSAVVSAFDSDQSAVLVLSDAQVIDGCGHVVANSFMRLRGDFVPGFWANLVRNRFLGCAMAVRRKVLEAALPFPSTIPMHDMWLGMMSTALGPLHYLPEPLIQYRRHARNASPARRQSIGRMLSWRWNLAWAYARRIAALRSMDTQER